VNLGWRILLLAALVWLESSASASTTPFRVVVRVTSEVSRTFRDRVVGQTSDLEIELSTAENQRLESTLTEQLDSATELARTRGAEAVVWCDDASSHARGGFMVFVAQPGSNRVLVRTVGTGKPPTAAELEASALIVRLAVQALMQGGMIGVEPRELPSLPRAPEPVPPPAIEHPPEPAIAVKSHVLALLGWQAAIDGQSPLGEQGLAMRLGLAYGGWEAGLTATMGLGARISDRWARIDLARHTLGAWGGIAVGRVGPLSLLAGAQAGVAVFVRSTTPLVPELVPTGSSRILSFFVGPELRVLLARVPRGAVGLSLAVGCDFVPGAPVLGYTEEGRFQAERPLFRLQPRSALQVELMAP
jgi:hypothetical protein